MKKYIHHTERAVSFLGSVSSIVGLLIALPASFFAYQFGKKKGEAQTLAKVVETIDNQDIQP